MLRLAGMIGDSIVRKSKMSRLAGMIGNSKVEERGMSRQMHLESAARHELLDNVQAGGHALGSVGLHAPHPLELHYVPANRSTSCVSTSEATQICFQKTIRAEGV